MPQIINTNTLSLNAQRNLNASQSSLATSLQRLSSGLRINSAKDDAAGLAISERMTAQVRGLNQAIRNANDGISLAQTAEGALSETANALQRIRELAVQSANATNSSSDRSALNEEVAQLIGEITRIGDTASFNGLKMLNGTYTNQVYQIGPDVGQTLSVTLQDSRAVALGAVELASATGLTGTVDYTTGITLQGTAIDTSAASSLNDVVNAINVQAATTGVTANIGTTNRVDTGTYGAPSGAAATLVINGTSINLGDGADIDTAVAAINAEASRTGVFAEKNSGNVELYNTSGGDITVTDDGTQDVLGGIGTTATTYIAGIELSAKVGTTITAGGTLATTLNVASATQSSFELSTSTVLTSDAATKTLKAVDFALSQVNGIRADLGAIQSRFDSVIANLSTSAENVSAARSRIRDADFAQETANLTRAQILQQAGVSVLAQANAQPQSVLALLQ